MSGEPLEQRAETGQPVPPANITREFLDTFRALLPVGHQEYKKRLGSSYGTWMLTGRDIDRVVFTEGDVKYDIIKDNSKGGVLVRAERNTPEGIQVRYVWDTDGDGKADFIQEGEMPGHLISTKQMVRVASLPQAVKTKVEPVVAAFYQSSMQAGIDYMNRKATERIAGKMPNSPQA